jgi:hypothetical protein
MCAVGLRIKNPNTEKGRIKFTNLAYEWSEFVHSTCLELSDKVSCLRLRQRCPVALVELQRAGLGSLPPRMAALAFTINAYQYHITQHIRLRLQGMLIFSLGAIN